MGGGTETRWENLEREQISKGSVRKTMEGYHVRQGNTGEMVKY